ncbi:hypothetical protein GCM10009765_23720 [Fodinicola feengrottensis]|uniref:4Fe-4S Wbl-type domain-containing protein n=1 Tax=Fodinicola feengrottensis TaxID=435914 RepID=A0ABN2GM56_9ACTN
MDTVAICECVAGGICRSRGIDVSHSVALIWTDPNDTREPDTIVNPAQLDQLIAATEIVDATCHTCGGETVTACPAFAPYLQNAKWEPTFCRPRRTALRSTVKEILLTAEDRITCAAELATAIATALNTHGSHTIRTDDEERPGSMVNPLDYLNNPIDILWDSGDIGLEALAYWRRVLERYQKIATTK